MGARADILCWVLHWGGGLYEEGDIAGSGSMLLLGVGT